MLAPLDEFQQHFVSSAVTMADENYDADESSGEDINSDYPNGDVSDSCDGSDSLDDDGDGDVDGEHHGQMNYSDGGHCPQDTVDDDL